jgi:isoleucyl-tRNA synthetase
VAEEMWRNLTRGTGATDSVHLADYPVPDEHLVDDRLEAAMDAVRHVVEIGRRIRVETKTKTRQPLAEAVVHLPGDHGQLQALLPLIADELNVKSVTFAETSASLGRWRAKPNYKSLGPRLGSRVKELAAILDRDDGSLAARLAGGDPVELELDGESLELDPDDVDMTQEIAEGWGVGSEGGVTVALDLDVSDELRLEGVARELVRGVQDARKAAGLDVTDRIVLAIDAAGRAAQAVAMFDRYIAAETLATTVGRSIDDPIVRQDIEVDGDAVTVAIGRA